MEFLLLTLFSGIREEQGLLNICYSSRFDGVFLVPITGSSRKT